jgi:hypothetical protein
MSCKSAYIIGLDLFFFLFNNFIGGADDDDMLEYLNLDLNNIDSRSSFIEKKIKPFFESAFSESQKAELLEFLNDISLGKVEIKINDFENQLFPFKTPNDIRDFCNTVKSVLFFIENSLK